MITPKCWLGVTPWRVQPATHIHVHVSKLIRIIPFDVNEKHAVYSLCTMNNFLIVYDMHMGLESLELTLKINSIAY